MLICGMLCHSRAQSTVREAPLNGRALVSYLRFLYEAEHPTAYRFRYGLLAFDIITILFIVATSFLERSPIIAIVDILFGLLILADFAARLLISKRRISDLLQLATWADAVAIISFLDAPFVGEGAAFLRVLRTLRLLHTYQTLARLRADSAWFRRNEEITISIVHLAVFLFVMTAIVYETQHWRNSEIRNYIDALYFTVTALRRPALAVSHCRARQAASSPWSS